MNKKGKLIISLSVIVAALTLLIGSGLKNNTGSYLTIAEALAVRKTSADKFIQMEGNLVDGSTTWDADKIELKFALTDGSNKVNVTYNGVKPDNFDSGYPIIVEGKFNDSDFVAETVKVKCPSKYEAETVEKGD